MGQTWAQLAKAIDAMPLHEQNAPVRFLEPYDEGVCFEGVGLIRATEDIFMKLDVDDEPMTPPLYAFEVTVQYLREGASCAAPAYTVVAPDMDSAYKKAFSWTIDSEHTKLYPGAIRVMTAWQISDDPVRIAVPRGEWMLR